jgi:hypothetical protein
MDRRILVSAVAVVLITLILGGAASDAKAAVGAADVLGGTGEDGSGEGRDLVSEKIYQLADKIAQISRIFIYLVGIFFVGRMLLIVFSSQIGVSGGKPGAIADMTSEMVFALLSFLLAVDTPRLAQAFAAIAMQNIDAATSAEISAMGTVIEPIAGFVIGLLGTLVFVGFAVNFVFAGTQAVVTAAIGNPGGISTGVSKALSLVFTLLLGFAFLRTGQWIFQNFFSL